MAAKPEQIVSDLVKQAVDTFDATLKAGVKIQEEATKMWTQALGGATSAHQWQERATAVLNEAIPLAQKQGQEYLRLLEQNSRNSLELLHKAIDTGQSESVSDAQAKAQELWVATLNTLRSNTEAAVEANAKALDAWSALARKTANGDGSTPEG
jgi:hypothetical protein